jgi:hypothetical protein
MIVLLVGLLFISTPLYISPAGYHWTPYLLEDSSTHNETLTEVSPVFRYNVTPVSSMVRISSLHTNDTPVTLLVRGSSQAHFNATNITFLEGYPVEVERVESDLWVEVVRQGSDANITITVYYQTGQTAFPPPIVPAPVFNFTPILGWVLSAYAFLRLVLTTTRPGFPRRVMVGLAIAFVLVLVGSNCCYPIIRGQLQHDFDPVSTLVTLPDEEHSFLLNATHPSSSLNLSSLFSGDGTVVKYKVHTIISDNYPVTLAISDGDEFTLVLEEECQNNDWWFPIPATSEQSVQFGFDRVDSDAEVTLRVGITYWTLLPREDITLPADLCAIGIVVSVFGLGVTVMVDRYSSSGSSSPKDRPPSIE